MYHKVTIVGYLGGDPVQRYTPTGTPVTNFSVPTNRKWTDGEGNKQEEVVWWRVTAWNRLAETTYEYLEKGRLVLVEGNIKPDENGSPRVFQRNDGTPGAAYEITAQNIRFLGGGQSTSQSDGFPTEQEIETVEEVPF